jgi:hypothetical protein
MSTVELSFVVISVLTVGVVGRYARTVVLRQIAPGLLFSSKLCCWLRTCRVVGPVGINHRLDAGGSGPHSWHSS